jgi:hypothetical protein
MLGDVAAARPGHRGERGARPGARACRRGSGRVAGGRAVGSYELLKMVIRSSQAAPHGKTGSARNRNEAPGRVQAFLIRVKGLLTTAATVPGRWHGGPYRAMVRHGGVRGGAGCSRRWLHWRPTVRAMSAPTALAGA